MPLLNFKEECERRRLLESTRDRENREDRRSDMSRERYSRDRSYERDMRDRDRDRGHRAMSGHTNSNDPKMLMSRVFIGNLPNDKVGREELTDMFSKYGRVLAVNILKGFGFIQFEDEAEARKAVSMENGGLLKGQRVDVKMAVEGKKKPGPPSGGRPPPYDSRPPYRERSPVRERPPHTYDRVAPRDHYDEPYRARAPIKEPYDSYRRDPYVDPYVARDPYPVSPRDPYLPARSVYGARSVPSPGTIERPPVDCEVTVVDRVCSDYGDSIERRLKVTGMATFVNVLLSEDLLSKAQEDIAKRGIPFNIVVSSLNQQHRSMTVRILHGTPQEHRNMPLEDAIKLVVQSFETYLKNRRTKPAVAAAPVAATPPAPAASEELINPDQETSYLLHLLADNRFLTAEELTKIIRYLTGRRDRMLGTQSSVPAKAQDVSKEEASLVQQQQELQAKILSVLGSTGSGDQSSPAATSSALQQLTAYGNATSSAGLSELAANASSLLAASSTTTNGSSQAYNLNSPGVQQALDNLMSTSSGLLHNLGGQVAESAPPENQDSLFQGYGAYSRY